MPDPTFKIDSTTVLSKSGTTVTIGNVTLSNSTIVYPSNAIIQTKINQGTSQKSVSSSSTPVDVLNASITTGSQNSKVLISFSCRTYTASNSTETAIMFGTTAGNTGDIEFFYTGWDSSGANAGRPMCQTLWDANQSTTHTVYVTFRSSGTNTVYINPNGATDGTYVLTLQEIAD